MKKMVKDHGIGSLKPDIFEVKCGFGENRVKGEEELR